MRWLAPLLILFEKDKNVEVLSKERELILQEENESLKAELVSLAMTIASKYFEKNFLFDFFKEEIVMLKSASIVKE